MPRSTCPRVVCLTLTGLAIALPLIGCGAVPQLPPILSQTQLRPSTTTTTTTPSAAQSSATAQMEAQTRDRINAIRQQQRLQPLRQNDKLAQVARNYSRRMAEQNFFAHTSPQGDTTVDRVRSAGIFYFEIGENLFMCTNFPQPVPAAVTGWMNSPGHRENILRPEYRETGVGVWRRGNTYYFTQLFLRAVQ